MKTAVLLLILNSAAVLDVFNGGEDYELLMAIKPADFEKIKGHPLLTTIGHFTDQKEVCNMITGLGQSIPIEAQGWSNFKKPLT